MTKKQRYKFFIEYFSIHKPNVGPELNFDSPFHFLIAVILSAQCTDKRVNLITPPLFSKYSTAFDLALATYEEVFQYIKSCSYPNSKTKYIVDMSKILVKEFNGELPKSSEELQKLPGVGRKTANVIGSVLYNEAVMPVDTHVFRVANRIGLTSNAKTPIESEKQLTKNIPDNIMNLAHHWLILHGRYICKARKPLCDECGINNICRYEARHVSTN